MSKTFEDPPIALGLLGLLAETSPGRCRCFPPDLVVSRSVVAVLAQRGAAQDHGTAPENTAGAMVVLSVGIKENLMV